MVRTYLGMFFTEGFTDFLLVSREEPYKALKGLIRPLRDL